MFEVQCTSWGNHILMYLVVVEYTEIGGKWEFKIKIVWLSENVGRRSGAEVVAVHTP